MMKSLKLKTASLLLTGGLLFSMLNIENVKAENNNAEMYFNEHFSVDAPIPIGEYGKVFTGNSVAQNILNKNINGVTVVSKTYGDLSNSVDIVVDTKIFKKNNTALLNREELQQYYLLEMAVKKATTEKIIVTFTAIPNQKKQTYLLALTIKESNGKIIAEESSEHELYVNKPSENKYTDIKNHWAEQHINNLANQGILTTSNKYNPNDFITRAQFSAMLSRTIPNASGFIFNTFVDTKEHWAEENIRTLYSLGIVKGTSSSTFNPNSHITRQQAAIMIYRYLEKLDVNLATVSMRKPFKDAHLMSEEGYLSVHTLAELNILNGKGENFDPKGKLTRAQMAKILDNVLNYKNIYKLN